MCLTFRLGFAHQSHQKPEENSGGDATRGGSDPSGEGTQDPLFRHRLFDSLGQKMTKSGEGDGGPGATPVGQWLINSQGAENDP